MDTLDLTSILEKYNNKLLISLQSELMNSFKEDLLKNIKTEIYNLFINNKNTENINICGFKRTRKRGYCKRHVKGYICTHHLKQLKNNCSISLLPNELPDEILYGKDIKNETFSGFYKNEENINDEINLLSNIEIDQSNNCINNKVENKNNLKEIVNPISEVIIDDKVIDNTILESENKCSTLLNKKKNKKKKKNKNKKVVEKGDLEKINKNIKVEFIKDTKGKMYAKNPFPNDFIIYNKYNCKCYIPVEYNGVDKIKIYLVNPKDKKDYKINIIEISELEDLMLTIYTEETVNKYFNR